MANGVNRSAYGEVGEWNKVNATNLIETLGGKKAIEGMAQNLMGEYGLIVLGCFFMLLGKDLLSNVVQGLIIFIGNSWKNDEILYLNGRQARIVRKGFFSTCFFLPDRHTAMSIPNCNLKDCVVERMLPNGDLPEYLPKGNEKEPMSVKVVNTKPRTRKRK